MSERTNKAHLPAIAAGIGTLHKQVAGHHRA